MEKENKKFRSEAKKKFNQQVKALVQFVKQKDKRFQAWKKLQEERQKEKEAAVAKKLLEEKDRQRAERKKLLEMARETRTKKNSIDERHLAVCIFFAPLLLLIEKFV